MGPLHRLSKLEAGIFEASLGVGHRGPDERSKNSDPGRALPLQPPADPRRLSEPLPSFGTGVASRGHGGARTREVGHRTDVLGQAQQAAPILPSVSRDALPG